MSDTKSKIEMRKEGFLKTHDITSLKFQQESRAVKLRKEKRMEFVKKRRISDNLSSASMDFKVPKEAIREFLIGKYPELGDDRFPCIRKIDILVKEIKIAQSYEELSYALESLKVIYGKNMTMPNDYIFTEEFIDIFIVLLNSDFIRGKILILAILANAFASKGKIIDRFISKDIIKITKDIIKMHVDVGLTDNGLYVLGNIIGEGLAYRNKVIEEGAHNIILDLLVSEAFKPSQTAWKLCIWVLNNLCKRPVDKIFASKIINAMPLLLKIRPDDYETTSNLLYIGKSLASQSLENCILISKKNLFPLYLKYCIDPKREFSSPSLKFIGNIVYFSNDLTKILLDMGLLPRLISNLTNRSQETQKDVLSIFSNIFLSIKPIVLAVINDSCFNTYLKILNMGSESIRTSAFLGLCNAISLKDIEIIVSLLNFGFLEKILEFSNSSSIETLQKVLSSLRTIFKIASDVMNDNQYQDFLKKFTSIGGCDVLEKLQDHKNDDIHLEAKMIIEEFIGAETDEVSLNPVDTFNFS
ncbi:hypothetical protein SteCoe_4725 [Stentor coeruleus]|uniref:IBB domain-containing protein n=1 Tax=Stentor coeruleus TaxID=5963 RepID=A0A1R2CU45_9CILI|nr:hypothetical protein SteCoe_4725 [Stentor coeruleus]